MMKPVNDLSLKEIATWLPNSDEEWKLLFQRIESASDREAAIISSAFLEAALKLALACTVSDQMHAELFEGPTASLADFAPKIQMAAALGIVGTNVRRKLEYIRKIRNVFAHSILPFDFENRAVANLCAKLDERQVEDFSVQVMSMPRRRFCGECIYISRKLVAYSFERGGKTIEVFYED